MPRTRLAASLRTVHAELVRHPTLSPAERAQLQAALVEIQAALDEDKAAPPADVVQRVEAAALAWEQRHPALTTLLQELADAARGAGI